MVQVVVEDEEETFAFLGFVFFGNIDPMQNQRHDHESGLRVESLRKGVIKKSARRKSSLIIHRADEDTYC